MPIRNKKRWLTFPGVMSAVLLVIVAVSTLLAALLLDAFSIRLVGGGSITTMFPGYVYAYALILNASLIGAVVLAIVAAGARFFYPNATSIVTNPNGQASSKS